MGSVFLGEAGVLGSPVGEPVPSRATRELAVPVRSLREAGPVGEGGVIGFRTVVSAAVAICCTEGPEAPEVLKAQ